MELFTKYFVIRLIARLQYKMSEVGRYTTSVAHGSNTRAIDKKLSDEIKDLVGASPK